MTKPPGLTEAMRRTIEYPRSATHGMRSKAIAAGFITMERDDDDPSNYVGYPITPRGQAALAAPRVTALELESLCAVERSGIRHGLGDRRLDRESWITRDYVGAPWKLTPAGATALNNVRAASGSADWKEAK